jgi:hypothetical protein
MMGLLRLVLGLFQIFLLGFIRVITLVMTHGAVFFGGILRVILFQETSLMPPVLVILLL